MIEIRYLVHVAALAQHRNFARAARELGISQPALTRSIQTLESNLGVKLFDRQPRDIVPTAFGSLLIERAEGIIKDATRLQRDLEHVQGLEQGKLDIGADPVAARMLLGAATARFTTRYPGIDVNLKVQEWRRPAEALSNGDVELFVGTVDNLSQDDDLQVEMLEECHGVFFCRRDHPLSEVSNPAAAQLAEYPLALTSTADQKLQQLMGNIDYRRITCNDFSVLRSVICNSDAIGLTGLPLLQQDIETGHLVTLPVTDLEVSTRFAWACYRGRTLSPAAARFVGALHVRGDEAS